MGGPPMSRPPPNDGQPGSIFPFPALPADVRERTDDPTMQLLESLFAGYQTAVAAYQREPTPASWCELKRSYTCWRTAFDAECDGGEIT